MASPISLIDTFLLMRFLQLAVEFQAVVFIAHRVHIGDVVGAAFRDDPVFCRFHSRKLGAVAAGEVQRFLRLMTTPELSEPELVPTVAQQEK